MTGEILIGDVREQLRTLPERSVHCVVTSPPYWALRDYGVAGQLGLEATPGEYVAAMVEVFAEVWRVLRDDGMLWLNIGDSYAHNGACGGGSPVDDRKPEYGRKGNDSDAFGGRAQDAKSQREMKYRVPAGLKPKDLVGIPWRLAFALQDAGWYLRQDIIWSKPSPMPESVRDRCTKSHEYIFLLTKSQRYYFDAIAIQEPVSGGANHRGDGVNPKAKTPGKNSRIHIDRDVQHASRAIKNRQNESFSTAVTGLVEHRNARSVWKISSAGFPGAHFATFPPALPERCIKAGTSERGCCPTCGAPWKRIVEKQRVPTRPAHESKIYVDPENSPYEQHNGTIVGNRDPLRHITRTVTTGWQQTCKCPEREPIQCTVLDPFFGAGTTGLMAEHLGRNWLGCELNPEYAAMAEARIAAGYKPPKTKGPPRRKRTRRERLLFN